MTGRRAGFDFGLTTYLTGSDGTEWHAPQPFKQGLCSLAKASRELSRKHDGSHNRRRAKAHLARVHKRVAQRRQAFHWELAQQLCAQYDGIILETLNLHGMKALWGRKVSDLGFGTFVQILHHVAAKTGTIVHHIDPWFPSTKLCSVCGHLRAFITLRDRVWSCAVCGATHKRDYNASINIYREGALPLEKTMSDWLRPALVVDPRILGVHAGEYVKPAVKFILMRRVNLHHHDQDSATNVLGRIRVLGCWHVKPSALSSLFPLPAADHAVCNAW
jgi:putative transposase